MQWLNDLDRAVDERFSKNRNNNKNNNHQGQQKSNPSTTRTTTLSSLADQTISVSNSHTRRATIPTTLNSYSSSLLPPPTPIKSFINNKKSKNNIEIMSEENSNNDMIPNALINHESLDNKSTNNDENDTQNNNDNNSHDEVDSKRINLSSVETNFKKKMTLARPGRLLAIQRNYVDDEDDVEDNDNKVDEEDIVTPLNSNKSRVPFAASSKVSKRSSNKQLSPTDTSSTSNETCSDNNKINTKTSSTSFPQSSFWRAATVGTNNLTCNLTRVKTLEDDDDDDDEYVNDSPSQSIDVLNPPEKSNNQGDQSIINNINDNDDTDNDNNSAQSQIMQQQNNKQPSQEDLQYHEQNQMTPIEKSDDELSDPWDFLHEQPISFDDSMSENTHAGVTSPGRAKGSIGSTKDSSLPKSVTKLAYSRASSLSDDFTEFIVPRPIPTWGVTDDTPFDPSLNCYGVVHVRLLRAQRLPCSVGSSVHAVVSLPPWQGRVRTEPASAFLSTLEHGVCVSWEQISDSGLCSMVNASNSEESPVPSIAIELMFSPLGVGVFEFSMCLLSISCEVLMRNPGVWRSQWCQAAVAQLQYGSGKEYLEDGRKPLIQLEAMFAPTNYEAPPQPINDDSVNSILDSDDNDTILNRSSHSHPAALPDSSTEMSLPKSSATVATVVPSTPSRAHHLRVQSFWFPGMCSVCRAILIGRNQGFHCEDCDIDCCTDCRLHVDLQVPCGSATARMFVENSIQNKFSLGNLLSVVAPVDEANKALTKSIEQRNRTDSTAESIVSRGILEDVPKNDNPGIGCLKMQLVRACLFQKPMLPDSEPEEVAKVDGTGNLRHGDYYARVTWTGGKKPTRTQTIQQTSGMPNFGSGSMNFNVAHYGVEFRLEVIDANTDEPVGTTLITTQGILQQQRDQMIADGGLSLFQFFRGPVEFKNKRRVRLELRRGVKSGFSPDFFVAPKTNASSGNMNMIDGDGKINPGEITGWIEVLVCLEEDVSRLYGLKPVECQPRPAEELNMMSFQVHFARIGAIIADINRLVAGYKYMVSWKDPGFTAFTLICFVALCLKFNSEYSGSLPFLFLMISMVVMANNRRKGAIQNSFVRREVEATREAEKKVSVNYTLHRPVGTIDISVRRGKNIRSRDLGLPGSTACRVYWDPLRYGTESIKKKSLKVDKACASNHDIGFTHAQYSADPEWEEIFESDESRRLQQLLPNDGDFFETTKTSKSLIARFPVLQPFETNSTDVDEFGNFLNTRLQPWNTSPAAVVVEVRFQDILNNLPGFNDVFGEVSIPFSKLVENKEIDGWFQIMEVGSTRVVRLNGDHDASPVATKSNNNGDKSPRLDNGGVPGVKLHMTWTPPETTKKSNDTDREASIVIQEEFVRSAILAKKNKVDLVGSSIGAINTALGLGGNVQVVQNSLGSVLDILEGLRNALNFTDPFKSSMIFSAVVLVWVLLIVIPTRYLILAGGLGQYAATFMARYGGVFSNYNSDELKLYRKTDESEWGEVTEKEKEETKQNFIEIWISNFIRALPTDEDLRKTYFWESRRKGVRESEKHVGEKRKSRLQRLWKAQWYASVKLRSQSREVEHWEEVFAIIQGHRFLWWRNTREFDDGNVPLGYIYLSGHAGLTGPSPLELREMSPDDVELMVCIFGRGTKGQERITLLTKNNNDKENLEIAVLGVSAKDD